MATEKIKLFELDVNYDDVLKDNEELLQKIIELKNAQKELNKKITDTKTATENERKAFIKNQVILKNVTFQYNQNNKVLQSLNDTQLNNITTVEQARKALTATGTLWARQTKLEGENSKSSKKLAERKRELTDKLKKLEAATGDNTRNVGNYGTALKGLGTKLLAASGLTIGLTSVFKGFKEIISSTQLVGDKFEGYLGGLKESFNFLARSIANVDFTDLISGFREAFEEGKRYAEKLDEIADRQIALGLQKKSIELEIIRNRALLKDREADIESRKFATKEIIRLEQLKLDKTKELTGKAVENDLEAAASRSRLSKDEVQDIITNYDKYVDSFNEVIEKEKQLRENATETVQVLVGDELLRSRIFDQEKYNELILQEGKEFSKSFRLAIGYKQIDDKLRNSLKETIGASIDAEKEFARGKEKLVTLENTLNGELRKGTKLKKKATDENTKNHKTKVENLEIELAAYKLLNESNIKAGNEATIKNLEIELAAYELQNESKLESDQELTADLIEEEANRLNIIATKEHEINQQKYESGLIDKQEYELQKLQLDTDYSNAYLELIDETILQADEKNQEAIQKAKEQADIDKQNEIDRQVVDFENERIIAEENAITKQEWEREQLDLKYQTEIENAKKTGVDTSLIEEKYRLAKQKADIISFQTKAKLTGDFANNLANIFGKQSKAGKLAAAAAATISAIQGATGAFASLSSIPIVGPALGAAAAVAALAAGFANVKKIYAVKSGLPGDGDGGSVPSGGGGFSVSTSNISDGGLVPRAAIEGGSGQIEEGMTAALENAPQRNVLVVDEVTAKQNEQNEIDVSGEV